MNGVFLPFLSIYCKGIDSFYYRFGEYMYVKMDGEDEEGGL